MLMFCFPQNKRKRNDSEYSSPGPGRPKKGKRGRKAKPKEKEVSDCFVSFHRMKTHCLYYARYISELIDLFNMWQIHQAIAGSSRAALLFPSGLLSSAYYH